MKADVVRIHTAHLRDYLEEIESLMDEGNVSQAMEVMAQLEREGSALRYSIWNSYHRSGVINDV